MKFSDFLSEGKPVLLKTEEEIHAWLDKHRITGYTIDSDMKINVTHSVVFRDTHIEYLPVQFGKVDGNFIIANCGLKSLKGVALEVGKSFSCVGNRLQALTYGPAVVYHNYMANKNNLTSLKSPLKYLGKTFDISHNRPLKSLKGIINLISGDFDCQSCDLRSLADGPSKIVGNYLANGNLNLASLNGITSIIEGDLSFNETKVHSLRGLNRYLRKCNQIHLPDTITHDILSLVMIKGIKVNYNGKYDAAPELKNAIEIIKPFLESGNVFDAQEALMNAELDDYAS